MSDSKRKIVTLALSILTANTLLIAQEPDYGQNIIRHIEELSQFAPFTERANTPLNDYIYNELISIGVTPNILNFDNYHNGHSFSNTIIVDIAQGHTGESSVTNAITNTIDGLEISLNNNQNNTIIIAARLNDTETSSYFVETNVGLLLTIAEYYIHNPPPIQLKLVFLGADHDESSLGSHHFLDNFFPTKQNALIFLNLATWDSVIELDIGAQKSISPAWIISAISDASESYPITPRIPIIQSYLVHTNIDFPKSAISPYLEANIASIGLHPPRRPIEPSSLSHTMSAYQYLNFITTSITHMSTKIDEDWETNYIIMPNLKKIRIISETVLVSIILIVALSTLLFCFLHPRKIWRWAYNFFIHSWNTILILITMIIANILVSLLLNGVLAIRNFPYLWQHIPIAFFIIRIGIVTLFTVIFFHIFNNRLYNKNKKYSMTNVIIILAINNIFISTYQIEFSLLFIWTYCCCITYSFIYKRRWRLTIAILNIIPFIWILLGVFTYYRTTSVMKLLITPSHIFVIILTLTLLPPLLMLFRLKPIKSPLILFRKMRLATSLTILVSTLATIVFLIYSLFHSPYDENNPQPVYFTEMITTDPSSPPEYPHVLMISSPAPLNELTFMWGKITYRIETRENEYTVLLPPTESPLEIGIESRQLLQRKEYITTVASDSEINILEASLIDEEDLLIYDSNYTIRTQYPEEQQYSTFNIGAYPPLPHEIGFTLARRANPTLKITAHIDNPTQPIMITKSAAPVQLNEKLIAHALLDIDN